MFVIPCTLQYSTALYPFLPYGRTDLCPLQFGALQLGVLQLGALQLGN
jgi:hypothetical protein